MLDLLADGDCTDGAAARARGSLRPRHAAAQYAGFLEAARRGDFARAREYLDFRGLAPVRRGNELGADLARQLQVVLDRNLWIDPALPSDDPQGDTDDSLPDGRELIGTLDTGTGRSSSRSRRS